MTTFGAVAGPRLTNDLLNLVGLRPAPPPLTMGWCIDCHRRQNATADTHAPLDCVTCHHGADGAGRARDSPPLERPEPDVPVTRHPLSGRSRTCPGRATLGAGGAR